MSNTKCDFPHKEFRKLLANALEGIGGEAFAEILETLHTKTHGPDHGACIITAVAAWLVNTQGVSKDLIIRAFAEHLTTGEAVKTRIFAEQTHAKA